MPSTLLRRPAELLDRAADISFARRIIDALERLGVAPNADFALSTPGHVRARARTQDPATSHEAARSVGDLRGSQFDVLKVFRDFGHGKGFTDEELLRAYKRGVEAGIIRAQSDSGIRSRRRELADAFFVIDSGRRVPTRSGRLAVVWVLAEHVDPTPRLVAVSPNGDGDGGRLFDVESVRVPGT